MAIISGANFICSARVHPFIMFMGIWFEGNAAENPAGRCRIAGAQSDRLCVWISRTERGTQELVNRHVVVVVVVVVSHSGADISVIKLNYESSSAVCAFICTRSH